MYLAKRSFKILITHYPCDLSPPTTRLRRSIQTNGFLFAKLLNRPQDDRSSRLRHLRHHG